MAQVWCDVSYENEIQVERDLKANSEEMAFRLDGDEYEAAVVSNVDGYVENHDIP